MKPRYTHPSQWPKVRNFHRLICAFLRADRRYTEAANALRLAPAPYRAAFALVSFWGRAR